MDFLKFCVLKNRTILTHDGWGLCSSLNYKEKNIFVPILIKYVNNKAITEFREFMYRPVSREMKQ